MNRAFDNARPKIKAAAERAGRPFEEYYLDVHRSFNPLSDQLVRDPRKSVEADIVRLRSPRPEDLYAGFSEFDSWVMIYEVSGHTSFIQIIGQTGDEDIVQMLFGD